MSDYSNAAIHVRRDSKVIILSGYSSDLKKRELTAINDRVDFLLQGLSEGLEAMFDADIEYLSEKDLDARLALHGIAKASETAVKDFLRIGKYTHLLVADVQMKSEKHGSASLQIVSLSSDGESASTLKINLTATQTDPEINNLRQTILREFAEFRPLDVPK
jgi:hypothetical protein